MKTYSYILLFFMLLMILVSCAEEEDTFTKAAILKWKGDYAVDGCGFFLEIENKEYKPVNEEILGDEFKKSDSSSVIIKFMYLEEKITNWCGLMQFQIDGVRILTIEKN